MLAGVAARAAHRERTAGAAGATESLRNEMVRAAEASQAITLAALGADNAAGATAHPRTIALQEVPHA